MDIPRTVKLLEKFISQRVSEAKAEGVVVAISGGVDSAVAAALAKQALGEDKVLGLFLPSEVTPREDEKTVRSFAKALGITLHTHSIQPFIDLFNEMLDEPEENQIAYANILARIRPIFLYYYANSRNLLVLGTSNKSELMTGYFTKYGDGASDICPLGDVYKKNVFDLASYLEIPEQIISKPPSGGLWVGQTDEEELGISYSKLDKILQSLEHFGSRSEAANHAAVSEETVEEVESKISKSEHKRRGPIILKLGYRSPGLDWRMSL